MSKICFLVDDDLDDHEIFQIALENLDVNIELRTAFDGRDALDRLEKDVLFLPDYIFLDLNMPRLNGLQCLHELKKTERLKNIPVIIYTTSSEERHKSQAIDLGAQEFITKPANVDELSQKLSSIFKTVRKI